MGGKGGHLAELRELLLAEGPETFTQPLGLALKILAKGVEFSDGLGMLEVGVAHGRGHPRFELHHIRDGLLAELPGFLRAAKTRLALAGPGQKKHHQRRERH
jgi:hypothetical protein